KGGERGWAAQSTCRHIVGELCLADFDSFGRRRVTSAAQQPPEAEPAVPDFDPRALEQVKFGAARLDQDSTGRVLEGEPHSVSAGRVVMPATSLLGIALPSLNVHLVVIAGAVGDRASQGQFARGRA